MRYQITHITEYNYERPVNACHNETHLIPRNFSRQDCLSYQVQINPIALDYRERTDFFGNNVAYFSIQQPHQTLTVTATSEVIVEAEKAQFDFNQDIGWESVYERLHAKDEQENLEARQYLLDSPLVVSTRELADYAKPSFAKGQPLLQSVHNLMERIHIDFTYDPHFTTVSTPLDEVLQGFCTSCNWLSACTRYSSPLCQWLCRNSAATGSIAFDWCGRFTCLVFRLCIRCGLVGF